MIYCGGKLGFSGCSLLGWYRLAKVLTNLSWFCLGRFADGPAFSARFDATKVTALHYIIIIIAHRQTCNSSQFVSGLPNCFRTPKCTPITPIIRVFHVINKFHASKLVNNSKRRYFLFINR